MAISDTCVFEVYDSDLSDWVQIGTRQLVLSAEGGHLRILAVDSFQDETHRTDSAAGMRAVKVNNVKYVSGTQMSVNGGSTENINDTNLAESECTLRIAVRGDSNISLSNVKLWVYDGETESARAENVEVQAFERGESNTSWTEINDDSAGVGGSGDALSLANSGAATEHLYYIALSAKCEAAGRGDFALGFSATVS